MATHVKRKPSQRVNIGPGKDTLNDFARKYNLEIEEIYDCFNKDTAKKIVFSDTSDYWRATTDGYKLSVPHNGNIIFAVYRSVSATESTQVLTGVSMNSTNVIVESVEKFSGYMVCAALNDSIKGLVISEDGTYWDAEGLPVRNIGLPESVDEMVTKDYVDRILNGFVLAGDSRTVPFDTVPQLRSADIEVGQIAFTLGYNDVNDGGAAVYSIRAKTQSDVDDGTSVIFLDNGNVAEKIEKSKETVRFLFPANKTKTNWDCELIVTDNSVLMIDSGVDEEEVREYLIGFMVDHGITKVDYFLLSHYHSDHDGNVISFLNQSTVDFSETKWYLPDVSLGFESHKTAIISALQAADATYEVLTADKTVQLSPSVTMDIMGANANYIQFIDDNINTPGDLNPYSLCAMITHRNMKAFYTGDIGYPATQALQQFYDLPKVNVLKIPHHGLNTSYNREVDALFYATIQPDYATTGVNHYEFIRRVSETTPFSSDKREHVQFAYANGADILPLRFGAVEVTSNGDSVSLTEASRNVSSYFNATPMIYYVDASYTDTDCDGSEEHPFPDLNALMDSLADRQVATGIIVNIAAGTYPSLVLTSFPAEISLNPTGAVNIGSLLIKNCTSVYIMGNLNLKAVTIGNSNVTSKGTVTVLPDASYTHIYDNVVSVPVWEGGYGGALAPITFARSTIHFYSLVINGVNLPNDYAPSSLALVAQSRLNVRTLEIVNVTKPKYYVMQLSNGTFLTINQLSINDTDKVAFRLQFAAFLLIYNLTLGANFTANLIQDNGGFYNVLSTLKRGTTAQRPPNNHVMNGYVYLDTEVGGLIVKNNNYWYKATDGTTV